MEHPTIYKERQETIIYRYKLRKLFAERESIPIADLELTDYGKSLSVGGKIVALLGIEGFVKV